MRGLDAERCKDAAAEIRKRIAVSLAADDLTENLKWRWAIRKALAGRDFWLLIDGVHVSGWACDWPAGDAATERQDMAECDAAAFIAVPFGERVRGALIPGRYKPVQNRSCAHDAGEAFCAAGQLPASGWAAFVGVVLEDDFAASQD